MRAFTLFTSAAIAVLLTATPALAQTDPNPSPPITSARDNNRVTVAVGVASLPDYDGADSNDFSPVGAVIGTVRGHDFFTRGTQLYVNLIPNTGNVGINYELGVIGGIRTDRTGKVDNRQVRALGKIDTAYEVGGYVGIGKTGVITSDYDTLTARVAYVHDVSDTYDSYVITPQINYTTPLSVRTLVSMGVSGDYVGKGFGRTYSAVTPIGTLNSGLRTYDVNDSGFREINASLFVVQSLSGDLRHGFGIGAGVLYGRLLGKYKDSPIVADVGSADQWMGAVGLTYTF
ncbi:outer membrane scaffolding protein for murein synthesis (MipA/OmpV family) [Sphingomonas sp. PP-CE-3A-406]|uniref:MipA/OmpV family protein n=1 Tax=Sphingomonas sp. PP-CE-3A-406 TaxID=2135659 RepID=UPI000F126730|nr:MipA/OmpV family protein [Sphingomonas sp. PP-CE-3A-406]RMB51574.1 outer membrane scaffolding protein for murein synthesis (MipA/OmpV family) [Sphingomonas sp. PP-CE-3A-406]